MCTYGKHCHEIIIGHGSGDYLKSLFKDEKWDENQKKPVHKSTEYFGAFVTIPIRKCERKKRFQRKKKAIN